MLDYTDTSKTFLNEAKNPDDHQHLTMAPTKGLIDWRIEMTEKDLALFEAIAGDALEEHGYARASAQPTPRPVVWLEWARWQTGRVIWRIKWVLFRKPPKGGLEG